MKNALVLDSQENTKNTKKCNYRHKQIIAVFQ